MSSYLDLTNTEADGSWDWVEIHSTHMMHGTFSAPVMGLGYLLMSGSSSTTINPGTFTI